MLAHSRPDLPGQRLRILKAWRTRLVGRCCVSAEISRALIWLPMPVSSLCILMYCKSGFPRSGTEAATRAFLCGRFRPPSQFQSARSLALSIVDHPTSASHPNNILARWIAEIALALTQDRGPAHQGRGRRCRFTCSLASAGGPRVLLLSRNLGTCEKEDGSSERDHEPSCAMSLSDCILPSCPSCAAWPMAVSGPVPGFYRLIQFRCPRCSHSEIFDAGRSETALGPHWPARAGRFRGAVASL